VVKRPEVSTNITVRSSTRPVVPGMAAHPGG
jgi:hypothetical protein